MSAPFVVEGADVVWRSRLFRVERRQLRHEGELFERDVVVHPGAVAVIAENDRGEIGCLRQYRATIERELLELPAGTLDVEGEAPLDAARRELREELGYDAAEWSLLGRYLLSPGWTTQVMHIYRARGVTSVGRETQGPEERASSVHWLSPKALVEALGREDPVDTTTALAVARVYGNLD